MARYLRDRVGSRCRDVKTGKFVKCSLCGPRCPIRKR